MNIGTLDQRIRLEVKSVAVDPDYGTQTITWTTFATVWANVQDVLPSRAEKEGGGVRIENKPARIRMRYLAGVTSDMRVILLDRGNRELRIVSGPAELGRKEAIEVMAEESTTQGDAQ